jgi:hypothetical protein
VIAGGFEMAVVGTLLLLAVQRNLGRVHTATDSPDSPHEFLRRAIFIDVLPPTGKTRKPAFGLRGSGVFKSPRPNPGPVVAPGVLWNDVRTEVARRRSTCLQQFACF